MQNFCLSRHIELEGRSLPSDGPDRMRLFESLLRETSYFLVDLERSSPAPSPFDEDKVAQQCLEGTYDHRRAQSLVYLHLYGHAVRQANAIGILMEESCVQEGIQLWRSLFEACVICEFLTKCHKGAPGIFQKYVGYNLLRSWIRHRRAYNELRKSKGEQAYYDESEICQWEAVLRCRFGRRPGNYSWASRQFGHSPTFKELASKAGCDDMMILYNLASKQIHPTPGHRFALANLSLPLRMIPLIPVNDVTGIKQLDLDYLTVKPLIQITARATDFLSLDQALQYRLKALRKSGQDVLAELAA